MSSNFQGRHEANSPLVSLTDTVGILFRTDSFQLTALPNVGVSEILGQLIGPI